VAVQLRHQDFEVFCERCVDDKLAPSKSRGVEGWSIKDGTLGVAAFLSVVHLELTQEQTIIFPVEPVADDGMASERQMSPDLVAAPSVGGPQAQQAEAAQALLHVPLGGARAAMLGVGNHPGVAFAALAQRQIELTRIIA
jgi:hypothetical protein